MSTHICVTSSFFEFEIGQPHVHACCRCYACIMCDVLLSLRTGGGRTGVQFRYHVLAAFWRKQQPTPPPLGPQSWKAQVSWVSLLAFLEGCWDACWCSSCRGQEHPSRGRVPATRLKRARTGSRQPQLMVKVKQCQEHRALRVTARAPRMTTTRMLEAGSDLDLT